MKIELKCPQCGTHVETTEGNQVQCPQCKTSYNLRLVKIDKHDVFADAW